MRRLDEAEWHRRRERHRARIEPWVRPRLNRRVNGQSHPIDDFLFEYYSYRPGRLLRWHPGSDVVLLGTSACAYLEYPGYQTRADGVGIDIAHYFARLPAAERIQTLLQRTLNRPPRFGCYGLHEWAMVYRLEQESVRHNSWPLRLPPHDITQVVDEQGLCCTHFDAIRFFSPQARQLNVFNVSRTSQPDVEQPGCLHANMDLYKWAYKLSPLTSSEIVADCFELAREIRTVDMQASPYDLSDLGIDPICIETVEGRAEYVERQQDFTRRAEPLRARLLADATAIMAHFEEAAAYSHRHENAARLLVPGCTGTDGVHRS